MISAEVNSHWLFASEAMSNVWCGRVVLRTGAGGVMLICGEVGATGAEGGEGAAGGMGPWERTRLLEVLKAGAVVVECFEEAETAALGLDTVIRSRARKAVLL